MISHMSKYDLFYLYFIEGQKLSDIQYTLFSIMETKHGKGDYSTFPKLFEEWMLDKRENEEMYRIVSRDIRNCTTISKHMKTLLNDLILIMFDPVKFAETMEIHSGKYLLDMIPGHIPIYLMSNYNGPAFVEVGKRYPGLMHKFQDVIVSGKENTMKPQREIFELAQCRWNLHDNSKVLFIDDDVQNIYIAKQMGFETILYTTFESALVLFDSIIKERKNGII